MGVNDKVKTDLDLYKGMGVYATERSYPKANVGQIWKQYLKQLVNYAHLWKLKHCAKADADRRGCQRWGDNISFSGKGSFSGAISRYSHIFCKKSHQTSRSEKKNCTLIFSHFKSSSSYFAHAVHFETIGLLCLTGFWIIVAPKFIMHTTAGNHSLICIIEKLYHKNSLSVSGLSKRFFLSLLRVSKNMSADLEKKKKENYPPQSRPVGMATC